MPESPESHYRAALAEGRFEIQQCAACESHCFPPRVSCPTCGSSDLAWRRFSGRGTVHACTVVARRAEKGGPYNVVLVDLAEGPRLMSHVTGCAGEEVPIGAQVSATIESETYRLVFQKV